MKNLTKLFTLLVCCVAAMSLTSCLSNDNSDTSLDPATQKKYQDLMSGPYSGYAYFYKQKSDNSQSLDYNYYKGGASWNVTANSRMIVGNPQLLAAQMVKAFKSATIKASGNSTVAVDTTALKTPVAASDTVLYTIPSTGAVSGSTINFSGNFYILSEIRSDDGKPFYVYFMLTAPYGYYAGSYTGIGKMSMQFFLYSAYITDTKKDLTKLTSSDQVNSEDLRTVGLVLTTTEMKDKDSTNTTN